MQDMIKQIVDMDKEAQVLIDTALSKKANVENDLTEQRDEMRDQLLARARKRIAQNEPAEREAAKHSADLMEERAKNLSAAMEQRYAENGEAWISSIVKRVLEGKN